MGTGERHGRSGTPPRHLPGTPCWMSLLVRDLPRSEEFYRRLFGWRFRAGAEQLGPYVRALLDGQEVAGIGLPAPGGSAPVAWLPYLATDDADATADQIRTCGGTVGVGPLDAGEDGRMALAIDPAGAPFAVWQSRQSPGAADVTGPGTATWVELITPDAWAAAGFYGEVFGYRNEAVLTERDDIIRLHVDGLPVGDIRGVGDRLPAGRGPHWLVYFEVASTDHSARRVTELGGRVLRGPEESAHGRTALVTDPEGALFALVHTTERAAPPSMPA